MPSADAITGEPASLRHLEALVVLERSASLSAAASGLAMTQSGLTQALARLEGVVGRPLFERTARGTRPTAAGRLMARSAEEALALIDGALAEAPEARPAARRLSFTQLNALVAVEDAGGFRAAARQAGRSQPSLHRAMEHLERRIGLPLLERRADGVAATPLGAALAAATRRAHRLLAAGVEAARGAQDPTRRLRVGAAPLLRAGLLPAALAELCAGDPTVAVELVEGAHRELLETLLAGRLHLILGPLREAAPEGTVQHPLFLDELVIAARAGHPLAHGVPRPDRLLDFPWAASPIGTPRRAQWEAAMRAAGVQPPEPRLSCSSASVVRGLLLNGDWLAMLSPDQFRTERESGRLVAVPGLAPAAARRIGSTVRAGSSLDDVSTRLVAILQRLAGPRLR